MEEIALTDSESIQLAVWYVFYYGTPIAIYCYLKYRKKNEKTD